MRPDELKILILASYFNRPILLRRAMASVLAAGHDNWSMAFGDDGSSIPGRPIVEDVLAGHLHKIRFVHSGMTVEDKIRDGLALGRLANEAVKSSDADVAVVLCDDDELAPGYLAGLAEYFCDNPGVLHCYSQVRLFNPLLRTGQSTAGGRYARPVGPVNPAGLVDASQVAWRLDCCKKHGAWFRDTTKCVPGKPWAKDTDRSFFEALYERCGPCHPTGLLAQYKGVHDYQLLWHKDATGDSLRGYDGMCRELGGVVF